MNKEIETLLHLLETSYCSNCELTLNYKQSQKIRNYINKLQQKFNKAMELIERLNEYGFIEDEESFIAYEELRCDSNE